MKKYFYFKKKLFKAKIFTLGSILVGYAIYLRYKSVLLCGFQYRLLPVASLKAQVPRCRYSLIELKYIFHLISRCSDFTCQRTMHCSGWRLKIITKNVDIQVCHTYRAYLKLFSTYIVINK